MPNAMYVDLSSRKYVQDSFKKSTTETSDILIAPDGSGKHCQYDSSHI